MKKLLFLSFALIITAMTHGQSKMACCSKSATQQYAMLASDAKFRMSHKNPLPYHYQSSVGKAITYKTPDGKEAGAYELKAKKATNNYLLVIHEWYGLNDFIKHESEKLYNDIGNVNVIAL